MGQDLFKFLPSEMTVNILSRLPARTVMSCKCVSKPWLHLLETREFVESHLSHLPNAIPSLVVSDRESKKPYCSYRIVEFVDEVDLNCDAGERDHNCEDRLNVVFDFGPIFNKPVHSSANGLLFLCKRGCHPGNLIVCNPITRDYITLPCPEETSSKPKIFMETYGFGVSMSGQYKVVRMFRAAPLRGKPDQYECQVYTVGTASWRRIATGVPLRYASYAESSIGAFLNGNLHWLAFEKYEIRISCFDLETELFCTSSPPIGDPHRCKKLSVLGDCLCLCENGEDEYTGGYEIVIWLMKDYGDDKSWSMEFVIRKMLDTDFLGFLCPIKVFEDGDILIDWQWHGLLYYSSKTKTIREVHVSGLDLSFYCRAAIYTPSFLPLKTFAMENVSSY